MKLLMDKTSEGVTLITSADPYDNIKIYRINRDNWKMTPTKSGIYLLHGVSSQGLVSIYIGMSTTNMRSRISSHHVSGDKDWFGMLFAVPVDDPTLCPAIEADLIKQAIEADMVDVITNKAGEERHRNSQNVHVQPAVEKIQEALEIILGFDMFSFSSALEENVAKNTNNELLDLPQADILDLIKQDIIATEELGEAADFMVSEFAKFKDYNLELFRRPSRKGGIIIYGPGGKREGRIARGYVADGYFAREHMSIYLNSRNYPYLATAEEWLRQQLPDDGAVNITQEPKILLRLKTKEDVEVMVRVLNGQAEQECEKEEDNG